MMIRGTGIAKGLAIGCLTLALDGAGFLETANEVHRAVVLGSESAELQVVRIDIPPGTGTENITVPAADPGC